MFGYPDKEGGVYVIQNFIPPSIVEISLSFGLPTGRAFFRRGTVRSPLNLISSAHAAMPSLCVQATLLLNLYRCLEAEAEDANASINISTLIAKKRIYSNLVAIPLHVPCMS